MVKLQKHTMVVHGLEAGRHTDKRKMCRERDIKLVALLAK